MGPGDVLAIFGDAVDREDWPKVWEAAGVAFNRGACVFRAGARG
ncbi:hypothetical protein ABT160_23635 [Streptomyces sp. NPDC001941]